jgi:hypothetical protein
MYYITVTTQDAEGRPLGRAFQVPTLEAAHIALDEMIVKLRQQLDDVPILRAIDAEADQLRSQLSLPLPAPVEGGSAADARDAQKARSERLIELDQLRRQVVKRSL